MIITDYPHITTALPFAGEKGETMSDYICKVMIGILMICIGATKEKPKWFMVTMLICGGVNLGVGLHEIVTLLVTN